MLDQTFLDWLRATTEARWADPALRDTAGGLGELAWQPGTHWRGPISASDLEIVEAMFTVTLPPAYRRFLTSLHTPDPPMAATQVRGGRLVRVEHRLFTDWTGATTPVIAAFERPVQGLLRGVALGRWHPAWGRRPDGDVERASRLRALVAAGPRLIPLAGQRYLVALPGRDDGPVLAVHGADAAVFAPDLRAGLLRELGLPEFGGSAAAPGAEPGVDVDGAGVPAPSSGVDRIPFWDDVVGGIPWQPLDAPARA